MKNGFLESVENIIKEKNTRRNTNKAILIFACIVLICTTYVLIRPAITLDAEKRLTCSEENLSGHVHSDRCKDEAGNFACGYADFVLHSHEENCFDEQGNLICLLTEIREHQQDGSEIFFHRHTSECFDTDGELICEKRQVLRHQHTDTCFEAAKPVSEDLRDSETISTEKADEICSQSFDGDDYSVSVSYPKGCLPENVVLDVEEILPESADYATYYEQTEIHLPKDQGLVFCRFFDVSFLSNGTEVEPRASVDVQISYTDSVPQDESVSCNAVHFTDSGIEMIPAEIRESENGEDTITFSQDSFSVVGTAISALNLNDGSYIFYKDGVALGAVPGDLRAFEITVDERGHISPTKTEVSIDYITWTYQNGGLRNKKTGEYLSLDSSASTSASPVHIDARIINNAVRFSNTVAGTYRTITYYLGFNTIAKGYKTGTLFADGDYFLAAKVVEVSDAEIEPGDLEIDDQIKDTGCLVPKLNASQTEEHSLKYIWYRSDDNGQSWREVVRTKITGDHYNLAKDGSWLNVALDKGADKLYKAALAEIDGSQVVQSITSKEYRVPYYDDVQNGDFEKPAISTNVSDAEHYQPFLPNGTAGMVWKTTAQDGEIEYISVGSAAFQNMSYMWHNCESAAKGVQYAELNANMDGALYQDVLTVPGSTMYWSLAHRGRGPESMRGGSSYARDTMYVVMMSSALAEQYNVTTQSAVNDVIANPSRYPGVEVASVTDDNLKWYYHSGDYAVPEGQYLTRYFFVAGETAFDRYSPGSGLAHTIGNHLDDIHFSMELPPPAEGKVNLQIEKNIYGLDAEDAQNLLNKLEFEIDGTKVNGSDFKNFAANGEKGYTASYQIQIDIGTASSVTKTVKENLSTANFDKYDRTTTMSVNGGNAVNESSAQVTIHDQGSGQVSFSNYYERQTATIEIYKVDSNDSPLSGAVFSLEAFDGTNWRSVSNEIKVDSEGRAEISELQCDTLYQLKETAAPDGYHALTEPIYFKIISRGNEILVSPCDADGRVTQNWPTQVDNLTGENIGLKIINEKGLILPETGGTGTAHIRIIGACLIVIAILLAWWRRRYSMEGGSE